MEYTVLTICIVAAIWAMQVYVKRAISGRVKQTADQIGDPYDPRNIDATSTSSINSQMTTTSTPVTIEEVTDPYGEPVKGFEVSVNQRAEMDKERHEVIGSN